MKIGLTGLLVMLLLGVAGGKPLKAVFSGDFQIGAALGEKYVFQPYRQNKQALQLLGREFDCVTSENLMKPASLRPAPGKFNFKQADRFMKLAMRLHLDVVGHVLVWHAQTPQWFFEDAEGQPVSREQLIKTLRDHIHTVVKRYKGHVKYWDVVNEAVEVRSEVDPDHPVNPDGSTNKVHVAYFRESPWLKIIGPDYIELAFRFAHEADPNAILIYNDFGMTDPTKVDFVVNHIIRPLKHQGVAIDAVGIQAHWNLESPSPEEIGTAIGKFADIGVKVDITELDMTVLPLAYGYTGADINKQFELQDKLNPYRDGAPPEMLQKQADRYRAIFKVFESHKRDIQRVTFWGICDGDSWKNWFPVRGRTDYPLLFDRNYAPKPAYVALQNIHEKIARTP